MSPADKSARAEILGRSALTMPGGAGAPDRYVAVRLGAGKGLKAGVPYVLAVEYPEDAPRSVIVWNAGNETRRGFHTGNTLGDALKMPYVYGNPESVDYPLSGAWETWTSFFESLRDYLRKPEVVGADAVFLFTGDPTEPGKMLMTLTLDATDGERARTSSAEHG